MQTAMNFFYLILLIGLAAVVFLIFTKIKAGRRNGKIEGTTVETTRDHQSIIACAKSVAADRYGSVTKVEEIQDSDVATEYNMYFLMEGNRYKRGFGNRRLHHWRVEGYVFDEEDGKRQVTLDAYGDDFSTQMWYGYSKLDYFVMSSSTQARDALAQVL